MKNQRFTAYYYDPEKEDFPGFDSNELSVNGKFLSMITEVRSGLTLEDLLKVPRFESQEIVLIVPTDTDLDILNFNPCPEEF